MKGIYKIYGIFVLLLILLGVGTTLLGKQSKNRSQKQYIVDVNRMISTIREAGIEKIKMEDYPSIRSIDKLEDQSPEEFFNIHNDHDYLFRVVDGEYYRFDYIRSQNPLISQERMVLYLSLAIIFLIGTGMMIYIQINILKPFHQLIEVPYELAKGNLTIPLQENKNKYFGRFVWGLDLLRRKLEEDKGEELALQKEKKTLILSLSHDIKTPLSAIKLYSKVLSSGLYSEEEKRKDAAIHINEKADEIEAYVSQIMTASKDDFLKLSVEMGEFYLSDVLNEIQRYYKDKLAQMSTRFEVGAYEDCMLQGDLSRAVEVLQNIMENAVKYGDGTHVWIEISEEEDCRLVTISNHGSTLKTEETAHIFDCFWRGSNTRSEPGNGLGLYICRQLMQKMKGEIFAKCVNDIMSVTVVFLKI